MNAVTIYDVAKKAGVSIKSVSRVMNSESVRPETRAQVLAAAESLNYHPRLSARSLGGSRSFLIIVFVDARLTIDHWNSDQMSGYLPQIQLGATLVCREAGYHMLVELINHDSPTLRQDVGSVLATLRPDGVILTPPSSDSEAVLHALYDAGTAFVRLESDQDYRGGMCMRPDDQGAAQRMTEHLIELGHRRIGFITGDMRHGTSGARLAGYQTAMAAAGLQIGARWIEMGDFTLKSGREAGRSLLARNPDLSAIFASSDEMAHGCIEGLVDLGYSVPDDLSVAGFDDSPSARYSRPTLTTIRQPLADIAGQAAKSLILGEVAADGTRTTSARFFPDFQLVVRQSTAAPAR